MRRAGIKVWMLTGDKGLTAKQIGKACGIVGEDIDSKLFEIADEVDP